MSDPVDPRHEEPESELSGEGAGFKGKIRGYRLIDLVTGIILIWAVVVQPYLSDKKEEERWAARSHEHKVILEAQKDIAMAMSEFSFILTLPQDKREHLNLSMPQSLREKIYNDARRSGR